MSAEAPAKNVTKAKKPVKPSEHPPVAVMVKAAITNLKDRKGSSLAAIKKYVHANYKGIDMIRLAPFIRKFLIKAVTDGVFEQVKGTGAAGSFKLSAKTKAAPKEEKKPKAKKPATKKPKSDNPKKTTTKKPAAKKSVKKPAAKKPAAKKPAAEKPAAKKPAAKKPAAKKPAAKKPAAKKPAAKKPAAKKPTKAKKPAAKK